MAYAGYHFKEKASEHSLDSNKENNNGYPGFVLGKRAEPEELEDVTPLKKKNSGQYPGFTLRKKFDEENEPRSVIGDGRAGFGVSDSSFDPLNIWNTSIRINGDEYTHQVTDDQLVKLIKKAQRNKWNTLYIYDATGTMPHLEFAMRVASIIDNMGLSEEIKCCTQTEEYNDFPTLQSLIEDNRSKGALEWWTQMVRTPIRFPKIL